MTNKFYFVEKCSLDRLVYDIGIVYYNFRDHFPGLTEQKVIEIQNCVKDGTYTLSPIEVCSYASREEIMKQDFEDFFKVNESNTVNEDHIVYYGMKPTEEDSLVLMGIGRMLNLYFIDHNLFPNCYSFKMRIKNYYEIVSERENNVLMLFKLDLRNSALTLNRESLLCKLSHIVKDDKIIELVRKFLYSTILGECGREHHIKIMIPSVTLITDVLLNFAFMDFDKEFQLLFPELEYTRYIQEAFVYITNAEIKQAMPLDIFEHKVRRLFDKLNLSGKILSIVPGEGPVPCDNSEVSVSQDGKIQVKLIT